MVALVLAAALVCLALSWFVADRLFVLVRRPRPDMIETEQDTPRPEA